MKKQLTLTLAGLCLASAPMLSFADLSITNSTGSSSTSSISGFCTSKLPFGRGITPSCKTNVISTTDIKVACKELHGDCYANLYTGSDCGNGGELIATVHFNVDNGYVDYIPVDARYVISNSDAWHVKITDSANPNVCPSLQAVVKQ